MEEIGQFFRNMNRWDEMTELFVSLRDDGKLSVRSASEYESEEVGLTEEQAMICDRLHISDILQAVADAAFKLARRTQ